MNLVQLKAASAPVELFDRLPLLAARINAAHATVKRHVKATLAEMMAAGDDLQQAKRLVGHGKWLAWLRTHCPDVSERTAHLYRQLAKWRALVEDAMAKSATIADLERDQLKVPGVWRSGLSASQTRSRPSTRPSTTNRR